MGLATDMINEVAGHLVVGQKPMMKSISERTGACAGAIGAFIKALIIANSTFEELYA